MSPLRNRQPWGHRTLTGVLLGFAIVWDLTLGLLLNSGYVQLDVVVRVTLPLRDGSLCVPGLLAWATCGCAAAASRGVCGRGRRWWHGGADMNVLAAGITHRPLFVPPRTDVS